MTSMASTLPPVSARGQSLLARAAEELRMESRDGIRSAGSNLSSFPAHAVSIDLDLSKRFSPPAPHSARGSSTGSWPLQKDVLASGQQHLTIAGARGRRKGGHSGARRDSAAADDHELQSMCEQIGMKAAQKFKTVREAFRYLDADHDGKISRSEIHYFFRAYNIPAHIADRFFDKLDYDGSGEVEYGEITRYLARYIQSDYDNGGWSSPESGSEASTRMPSPEDVVEPTVGDVQAKNPMDREVQDALTFIGMKAKEKFGHARELFRRVDCNDDGRISKKEMRYFYRVFNLSETGADKLFNFMGGELTGDVSYHDFVGLVGPFLELPGTQAAMLQRPEGAPPSNRPSRRSSLLRSGAEPRPQSCPSARSSHIQEFGSISASSNDATVDVEKELRNVMKDIGAKLPLRFKHVRDAFRSLDLNHNGKIVRTEMRSFLRGFGWSHQVADRIFEALDEDGRGEIDFNMFMSHFDGILGPANRLAFRSVVVPVEDAKLRDEVNQLAGILGEKLLTKFSSARQALSTLDLSNDGRITQSDMRLFFRTMCMPKHEADKMFKCLCKDGADFVDYNDFLDLFGQGGKSGSRWRAVQDLKGTPKPAIWKMM